MTSAFQYDYVYYLRRTVSTCNGGYNSFLSTFSCSSLYSHPFPNSDMEFMQSCSGYPRRVIFSLPGLPYTLLQTMRITADRELYRAFHKLSSQKHGACLNFLFIYPFYCRKHLIGKYTVISGCEPLDSDCMWAGSRHARPVIITARPSVRKRNKCRSALLSHEFNVSSHSRGLCMPR